MPIKTIIIVDDDEEDRLILENILKEQLQFETISLDGGDSLIEYLNSNSIENKIVLLDIRMPKKDGFETLLEVKNDPKFKLLPIIIFTSSKNNNDVNRGYFLGANSYIAKPNYFEDYKELIRILKEYWLETSILPKVGGERHGNR